MEKIVTLEVHHFNDRNICDIKFVKSWDDSIYMECGIANHHSGFGPPPRGNIKFKLIKKECGFDMKAASEMVGNNILLRPHFPIHLTNDVATKLLKSN